MPDDILLVNGTELLVVDQGGNQMLVTEVETFVIAEVATQGPQGIQGVQGVQGVQGIQGVQGVPGTADLHYTFNQVSASASWTITHNLGKYPSVSIVDTAGTCVEGSVVHASANQLTVSFTAGFSGTAYLN